MGERPSPDQRVRPTCQECGYEDEATFTVRQLDTCDFECPRCGSRRFRFPPVGHSEGQGGESRAARLRRVARELRAQRQLSAAMELEAVADELDATQCPSCGSRLRDHDLVGDPPGYHLARRGLSRPCSNTWHDREDPARD